MKREPPTEVPRPRIVHMSIREAQRITKTVSDDSSLIVTIFKTEREWR
jgi:hypothetical protein